jgi:hypothetical protein
MYEMRLGVLGWLAGWAMKIENIIWLTRRLQSPALFARFGAEKVSSDDSV